MSSTTAARQETPLSGRSAIVTGASRGIGRECARALSAAGAELVLVARDMEAMGEVGRALTGRWAAFSCHMAYPDIVAGVLEKIRVRLGGAPDIVVNNAGEFFLAPIEETEPADFQRTLTVNLTSHFAFIREFLPDMRARGSGHIVTVGSIADHDAFPENAAYAASKYGTRGLHEVLRVETRGSGVRATLVSPGPVDTRLWDEVKPDDRPGFTRRTDMLRATAVADAVRYAVTCPADVNVDELRVSRT